MSLEIVGRGGQDQFEPYSLVALSRSFPGKSLDFLAPQEHNHKEIQGEFSVVADLFTELEQKLEAVLNQMEGLKRANAELREVIAQKDEALKEAGATLEKITRERELVRERIDKILNRLKILDLGEAV